MKPFAEYLDDAGYDRDRLKNRPQSVLVFTAYKNGEARKYATRAEAEKFSNLIEMSYYDPPGQAEYDVAQNAVYNRATAAWHTDFRQRWAHVPDRLFNLCHIEASERAAGYDEIDGYMQSVVDFAERVLGCTESQ